MIKAEQKATSVKGGEGSCESHTHVSLHTLSAGDLKIYLSTYPILRYHMNCKIMRQGIAPVAFSPSSLYIKYLESAHPLSVTWGIHIICYHFFLSNTVSTYFNRLMLGMYFMLSRTVS